MAAPETTGPPDAAVKSLRNAHQNTTPHEISFRDASLIEGPGAAEILSTFAEVPRGGVEPDPIGGKNLYVIWSGTLISDGADQVRLERITTDKVSPSPAQTSYELWSRESHCKVSRFGAEHVPLNLLRAVSPDERRNFRRQWISTFDEQRSRIGYHPMVRYVLLLVDAANDLRLVHEDNSTWTLASDEFGLETRIEKPTGRMASVSFTDIKGFREEFAFGGWHSQRLFPSEYPGWMRGQSVRDGVVDGPIVRFFDSVTPIPIPVESTFDWKVVATSAHDLKNNVVVLLDGSTMPPPTPVVPQASAVPPAVVTPDGLLTPRKDAINARPVWALSAALLGVGGLLWARQRFWRR